MFIKIGNLPKRMIKNPEKYILVILFVGVMAFWMTLCISIGNYNSGKPDHLQLYRVIHLCIIIFYGIIYIWSLGLYVFRIIEDYQDLSFVVGPGLLYYLIAFIYSGKWSLLDNFEVVIVCCGSYIISTVTAIILREFFERILRFYKSYWFGF